MSANEQGRPGMGISTLTVLKVASWKARLLAFIMDIVVVVGVALFILIKIQLPMDHAEALQEFSQTIEAYVVEAQEAEKTGTAPPALPDVMQNEKIRAMMETTMSTFLTVSLMYFGLLELFMRGSTLGKRTFRLRTIRVDTGLPCGVFDHVLRAMIKSFTLFGTALLWISFLVAFFNKNRRAGHDYIARTVVIAE